MSLGLILVMSLAVVAGFLLTLSRVIGWGRILRHSTLIDVIFTVVTCVLLAGTLTGILIGILAGLVLAGVLTVAKYVNRTVAGLSRPVAAQTEDWCPGGSAGAL